jgi:hypothetical protein
MTGFHFFWKDRSVLKRFETGVSLHSHTLHSHESLAFLPRHAHKIPIVAGMVRAQEEKYVARNGKVLDYSRAYWTPPLPALEAVKLERGQVEGTLGLRGMVSITDHDSIEACQRLRVMDGSPETPISLEWTVPLNPSFVHLGVHNLPASEAADIMASLASYTREPQAALLAGLLASLHEREKVLVVLNHPLWDEARAGLNEHRRMVAGFLSEHAKWIHAFELNGLRPWSENRSVVELAKAHGRPLISGGDRHGTEPNANVNLTNAASFEEFIDEIRRDGLSDVMFLPQYREPVKVRHMETTWDIVRNYPEYPGRARLLDRIYWEAEPGEPRAVSALLRGDPSVVKYFVATMRLFNCRRVKSALRAALAGHEEMAL